MAETILSGLTHLGLVTAFALVALIMWLSTKLSKYLTKGRVHASAIAIVIGLILAYVGGSVTGGQKGITDIALFAGVGLMGGAMLRDFAIVATGKRSSSNSLLISFSCKLILFTSFNNIFQFIINKWNPIFSIYFVFRYIF